MTVASSHFIGLISGTSLDAADGVLMSFNAGQPELLWHAQYPYPKELHQELTTVLKTGRNETGVRVIDKLSMDFHRHGIRATGDHGQTNRYFPGALVPAFHRARFSHPGRHRIVVDIDAIDDISWLPPLTAQEATGLDTGPVYSTENLDVSPNLAGAMAFPWLAREAIEDRPVDLYKTTGEHQNNQFQVIYRA